MDNKIEYNNIDNIINIIKDNIFFEINNEKDIFNNIIKLNEILNNIKINIKNNNNNYKYVVNSVMLYYLIFILSIIIKNYKIGNINDYDNIEIINNYVEKEIKSYYILYDINNNRDKFQQYIQQYSNIIQYDNYNSDIINIELIVDVNDTKIKNIVNDIDIKNAIYILLNIIDNLFNCLQTKHENFIDMINILKCNNIEIDDLKNFEIPVSNIKNIKNRKDIYFEYFDNIDDNFKNVLVLSDNEFNFDNINKNIENLFNIDDLKRLINIYNTEIINIEQINNNKNKGISFFINLDYLLNNILHENNNIIIMNLLEDLVKFIQKNNFFILISKKGSYDDMYNNDLKKTLQSIKKISKITITILISIIKVINKIINENNRKEFFSILNKINYVKDILNPI